MQRTTKTFIGGLIIGVIIGGVAMNIIMANLFIAHADAQSKITACHVLNDNEQSFQDCLVDA